MEIDEDIPANPIAMEVEEEPLVPLDHKEIECTFDDLYQDVPMRDETGDAHDAFEQWRRHSCGWGTPVDHTRALACLHEAAVKKHLPAMVELGRTYLYGIDTPVDARYGTAVLMEAATMGSKEAGRILAGEL